MSNAENVIQTIRYYNNGMIIVPLFILCLIVLLAKGKSNVKKRIFICFLISVIIIFNDISRSMIGKFVSLQTYYRFLWMVPILLVIAYVAVQYWSEIKEMRYRVLVVVLTAFLLFGVINVTYIDKEYLSKNINIDREEQGVIEVCDMISEHKKVEEPKVAFDNYLQLRVRCYDASIQWGISRKAYLYILRTGYGQNTGRYTKEEYIIQAVNSGIQVDQSALKNALKKKKIDYLVVNSQYGMEEYFEQIGWYVIDNAAGYSLYGKK